MADMIRIENDGPEIRATDYFESPAGAAGKLYLSTNAGAFRLLVPPVVEKAIPDMEMAKMCVVSRGPWPAARLPDAVEVLFDDGTDEPFALQLSPESLDRLPLDSDGGRVVTLSVWVEGPRKVFSRPCGYRRVPRVPWMKPWEGKTP